MGGPSRRRMARAREALRGAISLVDIGDGEGACSRAYYAMYHAACAALLSVPGRAPETVKTHSGLIATFHKTFVLPGTIDRAFGRSLSSMLQTRLIADYAGDAPSLNDAALAISQATMFIDALEAVLPSHTPDEV